MVSKRPERRRAGSGLRPQNPHALRVPAAPLAPQSGRGVRVGPEGAVVSSCSTSPARRCWPGATAKEPHPRAAPHGEGRNSSSSPGSHHVSAANPPHAVSGETEHAPTTRGAGSRPPSGAAATAIGVLGDNTILDRPRAPSRAWAQGVTHPKAKSNNLHEVDVQSGFPNDSVYERKHPVPRTG